MLILIFIKEILRPSTLGVKEDTLCVFLLKSLSPDYSLVFVNFVKIVKVLV